MKKGILAYVLAVLAITILYSCSSNQKKDKENSISPNIIFIMSDDHAMNAISSYGNSVNQTPNIDRIADEGVRFNNSFCTNAICAPSRAVMLTGKYSHVNGHINNLVTFDGSQQTFPKLLQENGYQTAMIGKWHLKSDPTGFDYWNILPGQGQYYNPDFIEMGEQKKVDGYVTDLITDFSMDWLDNRDKSKPFCLLVHHKAPHRNWMPRLDHINKFDNVDIPVPENYFDNYENRGPSAKNQQLSVIENMTMGYDLKLTQGKDSTEWINDYGDWAYQRMNDEQKETWNKAYLKKNNQFYEDKPQGKDLAIWKHRRYMEDYLATIESVDENIGRLLDYLDKNGLTENTIIVYTSDQGFFLGEHGWFDKRFMYDESLKMPLVVRYPNAVKKGLVSNDIVLNLDFAATFLDYAGVEIPEDIQGESLREVLAGNTSNDWRDAMYYHYYEHPSQHNVYRHYGVRTNNYKLIHFYHDEDYWELYDLQKDPHEMNNVYDNAEYAELVINLKNKLKELQVKYKEPNPKSYLEEYIANQKEEVKNLALKAPIKYITSYSDKYKGTGDYPLTDGFIKKITKHTAGEYSGYVGYEEKNMEIVLEYQGSENAETVNLFSIENVGAWIFRPQKVAFLISDNNKDFELLEAPKEIELISEEGTIRLQYKAELKGKSFKYLKIIAENIGFCPKGHVGENLPAWLFVDEIAVQ